ncbi:hypothetical protein SASPL_135673 [Salvia splendens]|uniref:Solute carrier family 25 (Peroxisomal adenine nucleotide transporter), member 17 n=1 Tax=Salvia splendens TaxID=180675 RepID=A0A8X8ZFX6_SALSN|nr:hypothetical protein SASPL_135673 [Salvia splendens]
MSNAIVNGIAGAGGGIVAQIITYPLQTVNTRQQTERIAKESIPPSASSPALIQIFHLIRSEGIGGLYSGLKPSLLGTAASQGIYYSFYQAFKNKAVALALANKTKGRGDGTPGMLSWLLVAALAGAYTYTQAERKIVEAKKEALLKEASQNALSQSSLTMQLAQLDSIKPRPYGTIQAACEVYNESGVAGFWKGIVPTLIMVCNPSIQFMIYESLLKRLRSRRSAKKQGSTNIKALEVNLLTCLVFSINLIFLVGAIAKLGATVCTYPLLVVKSRLQAKQEIGGNLSLRYSGTIDAIIKMIRYEAVRSFYKGMSTKIVQSVFAASVLFMVKEELVKIYDAMRSVK